MDTYGRHTNFVGAIIVTDLAMDDGLFALQILEVKFPEGEEWGCDFCSGPSVAVYEVDATGALGDAGHNTMYCQSCAVWHANAASDGGSDDTWMFRSHPRYRAVRSLVNNPTQMPLEVK